MIPLPSLRICFAHLTGEGGSSQEVPGLWRRLMAVLPPESGDRGRVFVDLSAVLWGRPHGQYAASSETHRRTLGSLLREWGLDRVLWGSDNIEEYLSLFRDAWPLSEEEWGQLAANAGVGFLES